MFLGTPAGNAGGMSHIYKSASAWIYYYSISHVSIHGHVIYIFPKDSMCKDALVYNQDNMLKL